MAKQTANDYIDMLENVYKGAPKLPENARETLVKITPIISIVFGILGVLAGLSLVTVSPLGMVNGMHSSGMLVVSGIATIAASALMIAAYPKVQKRLLSGWTLLFWAEVINVASSLLTLSVGSVLSTIIWAAIAFYILFQIKSYYK